MSARGAISLVCVAERDRYADPALARRVAAAAVRSELHTYPIEHFDAYLGEHEALVTDQVAFLARTLGARPDAQGVRGPGGREESSLR